MENRFSWQKKGAISVDEMCEVLGISRGFGFKLVREGEIPSIRLGKRYLVPTEALAKMLNDVKQDG